MTNQVDWTNRVAKWRSVFAGWQLGTKPTSDAECMAVRDHREATILLRAEVSALVNLLESKGVFEPAEYTAQVQEECRCLCDHYEKLFPGFKAIDDGMEVDTQIAAHTTRTWKP